MAPLRGRLRCDGTAGTRPRIVHCRAMSKTILLPLALFSLPALGQTITEHTYTALIDGGGRLKVTDTWTEKGKEPETRGSDNLWTLAMFEAAVQSVATGKNVSIDDTFTPELRSSAGVAEPTA